MIQDFLVEAKTELQKGIVVKGHPFRYATLATISEDGKPRLRNVVLRKVLDNLNLIFYTDRRSKKVEHIQENQEVSMLFYHPKLMLQLSISGTATLVEDKNRLQTYWNGIPLHSRKDYTTDSAPGSYQKNPDEVQYLNEEHHFCIVEIVPNSIEYLKLKRPNHIRASFTKAEQDWDGTFLVP